MSEKLRVTAMTTMVPLTEAVPSMTADGGEK